MNESDEMDENYQSSEGNETNEFNYIIDKKYKISKMIGCGFTSKVMLATDLKTHKEVAIKIYIPKFGESDFNMKISKEIEIMKRIDHTNVVKVIDHCEGTYFSSSMILPKRILYSVFEICENGELFDYIKVSGGLPETITRYYFKKIITAVKHLHENNIAHRDIKLENLFLTKKFDIVLGDFGFASYLDSDSNLFNYCGTKGYQSPESLEKKSNDYKSNDLFSLGVMLFILIFGGSPFNEAKSTDYRYKHIYLGQYDEFWEKIKKAIKKDYISESLMNLLNGLLKYNDRISIEDIEKSTWYNEETSSEHEANLEMLKRKIDVIEKREDYDLEIELYNLPQYFKMM